MRYLLFWGLMNELSVRRCLCGFANHEFKGGGYLPLPFIIGFQGLRCFCPKILGL